VLDDLVWEDFSRQASLVNNEGFQAQITHLVENNLAAQVAELLLAKIKPFPLVDIGGASSE